MSRVGCFGLFPLHIDTDIGPEVVEDARQNFAASVSTPLPPLPVAPVARPSSENRSQTSSTRIPRRILAANEIFVNEYDTSQMDHSMSSSLNSSVNSRQPRDLLAVADRRSMVDSTIPSIPSEEPSRADLGQDPAEAPGTPVRTRVRRNTIVTRSPEAEKKKPSLEIETVSPNQREKSRSQHDLGRPITPVTRLAFELEQCE